MPTPWAERTCSAHAASRSARIHPANIASTTCLPASIHLACSITLVFRPSPAALDGFNLKDLLGIQLDRVLGHYEPWNSQWPKLGRFAGSEHGR